MNRVNPTKVQKQRLLEANAHRCCVCKRPSIGFNFHHIDGDPSNTVDENLAVLCCEDHDRNQRPREYKPKVNHLELGKEEISRLKKSWEAFVAESKKPDPKVIATLSAYGRKESIHSLRLVMQWLDERIEYQRDYHLLDGDLDRLTDEVLNELASFGKSVKLALIDQLLPVEYCTCCHSSLSRTLKPAVVTRLTDPGWITDSVCSIYINPIQPSLALVFFLGEQQILSGSLHLCQGKYLHYSSEGIDDSIPIKPKPSVRRQATEIVNHILKEWSPAKTLIGTGDQDNPRIITALEFPKIWEKKFVRKAVAKKHYFR